MMTNLAVRQIDVYMSASHFDLGEQIQPFCKIAECRYNVYNNNDNNNNNNNNNNKG